MSALRVNLPGGGVRHLDPHTRQDYRPVLFSWVTTFEPVIVKPAERPAPRTIEHPKARRPPKERRPYLAHLTDEQVLAACQGRSQLDAAHALSCSQSSVARRLRQIRAGVTG